MTDSIGLPSVPAQVGKPRIIKTGPVPQPMRWQRYADSFTHTDVDIRYVGTCIVCERNLFHSSDSNDIRGAMGDNTWYPIDELNVRTCAICGNDYDSYKRAQAIIERDGLEACAPIAWPAPAPDVEAEDWRTYRVVRFFESDDHENEIIADGLTHEEAVAHCQDPQTSSQTATDPDKVALTEKYGDWFDGWESR